MKAQLGEKQNWVDSKDLAMMYQAAYRPQFYRALYALVHAEFRTRRAIGAPSPDNVKAQIKRWREQLRG